MSDAGTVGGEGLLGRWSRRKLETRAAPPVEPAPGQASGLPLAHPAPAPAVPVPALPDLETLGAGSDYTAFLQQGVPAALQRVALQRAWTSDAVIAGFRGMADYDWDFNAPGYGALWPTDDVAKLVRAVMVPPPPELVEAPDAAAPTVAEAPAVPVLEARGTGNGDANTGTANTRDANTGDASTGNEAALNGLESDPAPPLPRRHGSALPC